MAGSLGSVNRHFLFWPGLHSSGSFRVVPRSFRRFPGLFRLFPGYSGFIPACSGFIPGSLFRLEAIYLTRFANERPGVFRVRRLIFLKGDFNAKSAKAKAQREGAKAQGRKGRIQYFKER
jgi:hypothetical protein